MEYHGTGSFNPIALDKKCPSVFIKVCFITILISISYIQVIAQASTDTVQQLRKTMYLLPDGRSFSLEKWDSLEQAWGKGRITLQHNEEDDAKGIVHLVRLTDEMLQQAAARDKENEKALTALLDKQAPGFELADLEGKQWSLKKLRGKIVVLNFWFTSCSPCIREMPELNKLVASYNSKDVVFLGLTFNSKDQIRQFLKKCKFEYLLLPGSHNVDESYFINSWPTSIVISRKGDIKKIMQSDPNIREALEAVIQSLL